MFLKEYFEKVKFEKVSRKQQKHGKLPSMQFLTSQFSKFKHILLAMEVTELFRALITDALDERKEKKLLLAFTYFHMLCMLAVKALGSVQACRSLC